MDCHRRSPPWPDDRRTGRARHRDRSPTPRSGRTTRRRRTRERHRNRAPRGRAPVAGGSSRRPTPPCARRARTWDSPSPASGNRIAPWRPPQGDPQAGPSGHRGPCRSGPVVPPSSPPPGANVAACGHGPARDAAGRPHARQAGSGAPHRTGHAVRAEVGRVPLRGVPRRSGGGARQPQRAPPHPVLPRAGRTDPAVLPDARRRRRRDRDRRRHSAWTSTPSCNASIPAASRVALLAESTPASFVAFDLLALDRRDLRDEPFAVRRALLEEALGDSAAPMHLTPSTDRPRRRHGLVLALRGCGARRRRGQASGPGVPRGRARHDQGEARANRRLRRGRVPLAQVRRRGGVAAPRPLRRQTGCCTTWACRLPSPRRVGVSSSTNWRRTECPPSRATRGRHGRRSNTTPPRAGADPARPHVGTPARTWAGNRFDPALVCEVAYDHLQGDRFRHATTFRRWRPDRQPESCTYAQLDTVVPAELESVFRA